MLTRADHTLICIALHAIAPTGGGSDAFHLASRYAALHGIDTSNPEFFPRVGVAQRTAHDEYIQHAGIGPRALPPGVAFIDIAATLHRSDILAASPPVLTGLHPDECFCCHGHAANYFITDERGSLQCIGCRDCDDIPMRDVPAGHIVYVFGEPCAHDTNLAPIVAMLTGGSVTCAQPDITHPDARAFCDMLMLATTRAGAQNVVTVSPEHACYSVMHNGTHINVACGAIPHEPMHDATHD